jgi:hypothetical protein
VEEAIRGYELLGFSEIGKLLRKAMVDEYLVVVLEKELNSCQEELRREKATYIKMHPSEFILS